jgi:hypothetical protein
VPHDPIVADSDRLRFGGHSGTLAQPSIATR